MLNQCRLVKNREPKVDIFLKDVNFINYSELIIFIGN
jgi:hypothetical protein